MGRRRSVDEFDVETRPELLIQVLSNARAVLERYHTLEGAVEPGTDRSGASSQLGIDAELHAGCIPFEKDGERIEAMLKIWDADLNRFDMARSTFSNMLEKRIAVLESFLAAASSPQSVDATQNTSVQGVPPPLASMTLPRSSLSEIEGSDPSTWPETLKALVKAFAKMEILQLRNESCEAATQFLDASQKHWQLALASEEPDQHAQAFVVQRIVSVLTMFAVLYGSLHSVLVAIRILLEGASMFPSLTMQLSGNVHSLGRFQAQLDLSLPWNKAVFSTWSEPGSAPKRDAAKGKGIANDGNFLYIHNGCGLHKVGTGLHGTVRGHVYAHRKNYRNKELVHLACINKTLYALSNQFEWPFVDAIDCSELNDIGLVQLGYDPETSVPEKRADSLQFMISDGAHLYLFDQDSQEENSRKDTGSDSSTRMPQIAIYVYETSPDNDRPESGGRTPGRFAQETKALAQSLWKNFAYRFPLSLCTIALKVSRNDPNAAGRWLLNHGSSFDGCSRVRLCRRFLLQPMSGLTIGLLSRSLVYVTGHQLVVVIPPYTNDCNDSSEWLGRVFDCHTGNLIAEQSGGISATGLNACYDAVNDVIWNSHLPSFIQFQALHNHGPRLQLSNSLLPGFAAMSVEAMIEGLGNMENPRLFDVAVFLMCHAMRCLKQRSIMEPESNTVDDESGNDHPKSKKRSRRKLSRAKKQANAARSPSGTAPSPYPSTPLCFELSDKMFNELLTLSKNLATMLLAMDPGDKKVPRTAFLLISTFRLLRYHFEEIVSVSGPSECTPIFDASSISDHLQRMLVSPFPLAYCSDIRQEAGLALTAGFRLLFLTDSSQMDFISQTIKSALLLPHQAAQSTEFSEQLMHWLAQNIQDFEFVWRLPLDLVELVFELCAKNPYCNGNSGSHALLLAIVNAYVTQLPISSASPPEMSTGWLVAFSLRLFEQVRKLVDYRAAHEEKLGGIRRQNSRAQTDLQASIIAILPTILPSLGIVIRDATLSSAQILHLLSSTSTLISSFNNLNKALPSSAAEDRTYCDNVATELRNEVVVESSHPYANGANVIRETIYFPTSHAISITFDPRCSTKDHMDQLVFYTDVAMNCRAPIGPFFGNEQDRNANWLKRPVIIAGSTLSLSFSARSQPRDGDKTRWGFRCAFRGISFTTLSFTLDVQSLLCSAAGLFCSSLIRGPPVVDSESFFDDWVHRSLITEGLERYDLDDDDAKALRLCPVVVNDDSSSNCFSKSDSVLRSIIDGTASSLLTLLQQHEYRFIGNHLIRSLPTPIQQDWQRCIRAVMACMIKHSGLLFEFLQATRKHENCFSEGENGADGPSLYDKFRMVSVSAQSLQDWMLHQVQAIRRWHTFLVDHHQPTVTQLNEEFGHSDDHFNLLAICGYLGVDTTSLDSSGSDLNPVFSAIAELTAASPISVSPYEYICGHVSRAAEELMMFKASFPESDFPDSSLDVPDIWRSRSVATNLNSTAQSPIMRTLSVPVLPRDNALTALPAAQKGFESRVHHLRTSIQNYQHWKLWRQTVSQSAASARKDSPMSPLESILGLVRRRMKPNQMLKIAHTHYLRLRYRIAGLHTLSELVRSICFGSSRIALLGRLQSSLRESSCNSAASLEAGVCCCPSVWRESLLASFGSLFSTLIVFISDGSAPLAVRMLAFRDVYGIDFDAHHCRLIETWRMLDNVTNVVMHPKVNLSITSKGSTKVQEDFLDAVWAALRLVAFRMLRFSADDLQDDIALSVVLLDVKRFQRTVFQSLLSILRHFLGISSADESQRIASNRYIQRVASLLMLVSPLPSISLLNRPEFLQCFAVVLKHPAYYPLRVVRLIVRLARTVLSVVSPMSVVELFPDHFPTLLIRVIADLVVSDAEPNTKSKFCVIAHPSPGMNQAWWVRIVTHEIPELVSGSPPMDDPSFQLAEQLHREEAEQAYAIRSTYRSGPDSIPLKEIGGGSVQFLADNVVICKDGFATVVGEVSITSGRWYFELILQSSGVMQVGWCTLDMVASSSSGNGIGDDRRSWAYDGRRLSKWHGDQSRYSSKRWQAGDVVGVAIDLHDRVMRYYLNGVDLGIAFSGLEEIGEHGGVRPACSFAAGERARFVFDATQFRSSLPEGYFPLEGDKPMPRNNPLGRSHSIWCDLTQLGQAVVWRDNSDGCLSMASRLSRHGAIVTVVREASLESCSNKGASTVHNVFRLNGRGARAMASEFISLARFLLSPTLCTRAWSESLSSTINAVIEAYKDVADTSATSRLLLGCLCVLGGFSEPLRIGGYVDIDDEIGGRNLGVILDSIPGSAVVSVAMLDRPLDATMSSSNLGTSLRGSVTTVRKPSVVDTTSDPATRTSLAHRIRVDKIRTRSEFDVDLMNDFPLSKTHVACFISLSSIQQHSEGRWMLLELQLRSMLVLESLLRLANTDDSPSIRLATKHFRGLARSSSWRNFQYERVRNVVERSRDRVWDLSSDCFGWFAQPPVPGTTSNTAFEELCETSTPSASVDSNELFVYGSSCYLEQSGVGAIADDTSIQRMVRYWESRIIPHIQDYVRGSFRDYEMVYFFEQLRQPLRAGDVASAMKIVYTLCNQRVPDTVQFPALDHDWSQLMAEDISVGQALYVAQPSRSVSDGLDGGLPLQMANRIGTVQAVRPEKDLVMLQVYFEDEAILRSAWFPVNVLREPEQMDSVGSTESVDSIRTISDALEFLQSALAPLPVLLARRSIVSLCSQTSHFIANQLQAARDPGELLFASLSQCLQCSLPNVGTALVEHVATIERFERNLADALASSDAQFADQILDFMEKSLTTASAFLSSNTRVVLSGIDSLPQPYFTPGAASFVVEFAQDAFLPANTTFSVFADAECTRPIRHYVGGKSGCGRLQHCTVEGDRFWMRAGERPDASAFEGFRVRVTALSPDFALSFWIIRFLMEHSLPCFGENRSRIAFESIVRLFARFDLVHMAPSPVKQVILALVYDLVGLCETTSYLSNQDIAQSALVHIAELQPELIGLLADETVKPVFTSYVQQLLDLQVRADYLRHPDIRLAKSFDPGSPLSFGSEPADDGAAEDVPVDNSWACPICTLVNEDSSAICCACENPRPAVVESASLRETAPLSPYTVDRLREAASTRFDHVVGLVGIMKWLLGVVDIDACAPSQAILHAAWEVSRRESIQPRLVVVDGIPITHTESDARAHLLRSLEKVSAISGVPYLVDLESIFFGFNPELPPSDTLEDAATFLSQAPKMVVFEHDFPLDNNGIVWYLGTRACTEPFTNPVHLGLVGVTASSLQHDSTSADAVVGRDVVRCVTTPAENQWFEIEFKDMLISPTHYTLRHYISWHTEALRNWRFEALGSDGNWICLHEAVNDESLSAKGAAHTWHLPPVPTGQESSFSKFRIFMTGLNSNKHWYLALSGFEIYGSVTSESIVQKLPIRSSNRFAVFQLLNGSSPDVLDSLVNGLNGSVLEWPDWFRSRVTIQRFIDIPETDARITTYLKSRLVNVESSSLTEGFRNAIGEIFGAKTIRESHRLLLSPTTLEQVSFAAHWPLPSAAPGDAEEVVQVDAMCTLFQTSILDGSADPLSIWSWLFSLGFDLKFVRCSVPSETTAEAQQSAWTKLPTSAHLDYLEFIHGAADGCGADSLLTFPISELPCTERDLIGLKDLTLHAANTGLLSPESMRLRLIVLQQFNRMVIEMLPLVDLRRCDDDAGDSIGGLLRRCRPFVFRSVKRDFLTAIADITADMSWRPPVLHFNRMDLSLKHLLPDCDFVHDTFFGNAYLQMRDLSRTDLRPPRPSGTDPFLAFEVMFEGEDVVGQGGPYRQLFSDMSTELLTPFSPLFVPCPNQQGGIGDNQDMFVIRPSASASSSTMALFEFLGVILGCCIRTGVRVSLRLPPFTWKPMVLDTITPADLASVDRQTSLVLQLVATIEEDIFSDTIDETFSTPLSDRSTVLLRPHGDTQRVQCEERQEYIRLVHQARSNEAAPQVAAIRRGIDKVIPVQLLNLLLYSELELLVNGKHDVDIDLLRRHTRYSGVSPDAPHIDYFWSVLRSFSHDDRRRFIRFTWAQERLPVDDEEFLRTHTRLLIKSTSSSVSPDSRFPRADTCFFNLDLPAYSSQEILHQRLLFAITHTDSMNADVVADDPRDANIRVNDFSNMIP